MFKVMQSHGAKTEFLLFNSVWAEKLRRKAAELLPQLETRELLSIQLSSLQAKKSLDQN